MEPVAAAVKAIVRGATEMAAMAMANVGVTSGWVVLQHLLNHRVRRREMMLYRKTKKNFGGAGEAGEVGKVVRKREMMLYRKTGKNFGRAGEVEEVVKDCMCQLVANYFEIGQRL